MGRRDEDGPGSARAPACRRLRGRARAWALAASLAVAGWAAPAAAGDWVMDPAASQLSVTIDVGGRRMAGVFESWRADIAFDPAAPEACRVRVEVDVASLSFPDGMATASAAEPRWLAASEHPVAVFEGAGFHRDAPGAWTVRGDLTLKGETRPLELQVSILTQGETAEAEVSAALLRTDYAVGEPAEEMVGLAVTLEASVTARRLDEAPDPHAERRRPAK